jgi:hypothetical protein
MSPNLKQPWRFKQGPRKEEVVAQNNAEGKKRRRGL